MTLLKKPALIALAALSLSLSPGLAPAAPRQPIRTEQGAPAVTTVSFDFTSEIKTTFYSDGSVYEESFDPARMRRLATRAAPEPR